MDDLLIVGSGMAAIGAALGALQAQPKLRIRLIDVGFEASNEPPVDENIYDFCARTDAFDLLIGRDFEGLHNLKRGKRYLPARLTTPRFSFILKGTDELQPTLESSFSAVQSLSRGGLANAWGAGAFRYTERDLDGYPINKNDLEPFYDALTNEIGISGADDDLTPYFGSTYGLQPPLKMSTNAHQIFRRYQRRRERFQAKGIHIGRPRFAILSETKDGRRPHQYQNLEFWQPRLPEIYTPAYTLERLVRQGRITYESGLLATTFEETEDGVRLLARRLDSGERVSFRAHRLVIAAGTLNTAKIVLASYRDHQTELPLLDNPAIQVPLVLPWRIGQPLETRSFGSTHLNVVFDEGWGAGPLQGAFLDLTSPPRSEFFDKFPLSARANLALIRYVLPAMMVNLVFFPSSILPSGHLGLNPDQRLRVRGPERRLPQEIIARLIGSFRSLGLLSHSALTVHIPYGGGIHYAGTLPMRASPSGRYECAADGRLNETRSVYIADGAALPRLPAKNHSFTLMANAMRIGAGIGAEISTRIGAPSDDL